MTPQPHQAPDERPPRAEPGEVVVGVDGSPASRAALAFASCEARLRGDRLVVVHAYQPDPYLPPRADPLGNGRGDPIEQRARAVITDHLEQVTGDDVDVVALMPAGRADEELERLSATADLLVVGSRGHGRMVAAALGSVSRHAATHSACPVVVVPPGAVERRAPVGVGS